jgi:hypothetical protein
MTIDTTTPAVPQELLDSPIPFDLYREVHKGLRLALFDLTVALGRTDCSTAAGRADAAQRAQQVLHLLHAHHGHEDMFIQALVDLHAPRLAEVVEAGHVETDQDLVEIETLLERLTASTGGDAVAAGLDLYRFVALFTARYLAHMALEEGAVMSALRDAMSVAELFAVEMALRSSVAPPLMVEFMSIMLPAMNLDERTAMLGGMHAGAPTEVFSLFRAAAEAALPADDFAAVATRIGLV